MSNVSNTRRKAIQLIVSIGGVTCTFKSGVQLTVERNFGDTSNKFTFDVLDQATDNSIALDSILSAGGRKVTFQYADSESESLVTMSGLVWDYTSTFVGDLHQLNITGYVSKGSGNTGGVAIYNIDWNRYYWKGANGKNEGAPTQKFQGPGGSIERAIPQVFISVSKDDGGEKIAGDYYKKVKPGEPGYSNGFFVKYSGRKPSTIVKWLCDLEGWDTNNGATITPTAAISKDEDFIQTEMTAEQYINECLVPLSTTEDKKKSGFKFFFKGKTAYYQPVEGTDIKNLTSITLGYNVKNSPVISFQINTKGTAMITQQDDSVTGIELITGQAAGAINFSSDKSDTKDDAKLDDAGYNAQLASYLGISTEDWKEQGAGAFSTFHIGSLVQKINFSSGSADAMGAAGNNAADKMRQLMIKAELNMWGDSRIEPNSYIQITNLLKGGRQHYSSGRYLIMRQTDTIGSNGFTQNLQLIKNFDKSEAGKSSKSLTEIADDINKSNKTKTSTNKKGDIITYEDTGTACKITTRTTSDGKVTVYK